MHEKAEPDFSDPQTGGSRDGLPFPTDKPPKEYVVPNRPLTDTFHEEEGLPSEEQNPGWHSPAKRFVS